MKSIPKDLLKQLPEKLPESVLISLRAFVNAKALVGIMKPVHAEVCQAAMERFNPIVADSECGRIEDRVGEKLTDFDELYLAGDEVAKEIYAYHKTEMAHRGFHAEGEKCPFLVAKNYVCDARKVLFTSMEPYSFLAEKDLLQLKHREEYENILLDLLLPLAVKQGVRLSLLPE